MPPSSPGRPPLVVALVAILGLMVVLMARDTWKLLG